MHSSTILSLLCLAASSSFHVMALPRPGQAVAFQDRHLLETREDETVNPDAVLDTVCTNEGYVSPLSPFPSSPPLSPKITSLTPYRTIVFHDQNVALLSICGGIAGAIEFCGGDPSTTVGESGTAIFTLNAAEEGATINVSKGRWEGCVRAAVAVCPSGGFSSTCVGGASVGNVAFTLAQT